jgi:hypothetical protein
MEFFIGIIFGVLIGFIWGVWRATQSFIERIIERPDEIREIMRRVQEIDNNEETLNKELQQKKENKSDIRVEEHHGVYYLYDKSDKFLAQGPSLTEALDAAEKRFPNRKFYYRLNLPDEVNQ